MTPFGSLSDSSSLSLHRRLLAVVGDLATIAVACRPTSKSEFLNCGWRSPLKLRRTSSVSYGLLGCPVGGTTLLWRRNQVGHITSMTRECLAHISISVIGSSNFWWRWFSALEFGCITPERVTVHDRGRTNGLRLINYCISSVRDTAPYRHPCLSY